MLDWVFLAARLFLAGVFLISGAAKLVDQAGLRKTIVDFGLPQGTVRPLGLMLPLMELVLAVALLPAGTAWWAAAALLGLLVAFVVVVAINLSRGRRPACHCFGQLSSDPIGWETLLRNALLVAVAGCVLVRGPAAVGPGALDWMWSLNVSEGLTIAFGSTALLLLGGMVWLLVQLWALIGRLLLRIDALEASLTTGVAQGRSTPSGAQQAQGVGLPVGTAAPAFRLDGLHGEALSLDALLARHKPVVLLFADPNCGPCTALMPDVGAWQRDYASAVTLAVISRGTAEKNRHIAAEHGLANVLVQHDYEVAQAYQAYGTPSAVLVQADGTIASPVAPGLEAIKALVARTVHGDLRSLPVIQALNGHGNGHKRPAVDHAHRELMGAKMGEPAPALTLPDLDGNPVDLARFKGEEMLVLFWNPDCGFCQQMLPDLKAWEASRPQDAPQLLVVSTGSREANKQMGLRSLLLLATTLNAGSAFGANGTPSAVLVDASGRIASEVAVGAQAVLTLAQTGRRQTPIVPNLVLHRELPSRRSS